MRPKIWCRRQIARHCVGEGVEFERLGRGAGIRPLANVGQMPDRLLRPYRTIVQQASLGVHTPTGSPSRGNVKGRPDGDKDIVIDHFRP